MQSLRYSHPPAAAGSALIAGPERASHVLLAHRDRFFGDYVGNVMAAAGLDVQGPYRTRAEVQEAVAIAMPEVTVIGEVLDDGPSQAWAQQVFGPATPLLILCECGRAVAMQPETRWIERPFAAFQVVELVKQMAALLR